MTDVDRVAIVLYQLLFREEAEAVSACDFSLEVVKRNAQDQHAQLKHYENCVWLRAVKQLTRKVKETLDSMTDKEL